MRHHPKTIPPPRLYGRLIPNLGNLTPFLCFLFLLCSCAPALVNRANADDDPFELQYPDVTVESGKETRAPVTVKTKPGWKWNKEYPASAEITVEGPCDVTTQKLGKGGKSIEVKGKDAVFPVGLKGKAPGNAKVTVTANFSICNEETCRIFRKRVMGFPVKVK